MQVDKNTNNYILTKNQDYLHMIDLRLNWLQNEKEIKRLKTARKDVVSRMTEDELEQYKKFMKTQK